MVTFYYKKLKSQLNEHTRLQFFFHCPSYYNHEYKCVELLNNTNRLDQRPQNHTKTNHCKNCFDQQCEPIYLCGVKTLLVKLRSFLNVLQRDLKNDFVSTLKGG